MQEKTIIITGSSSGLGESLAYHYARERVRLYLFGRSLQRLHKVAETCESYGAEVHISLADVRDAILMKEQIDEIFRKHKIDIIICSAGVSAGTLGGIETQSQVSEIFATNLNGTVNTIMPALPYMLEQRSGAIVLISSMAGMMGLSSAPSYSASKGAVKMFGSALRAELKQYGIKVSVVIPGYIDTPMTKVNNFPMPMKISSEKAANIIAKGIEKAKGMIIFPKITYFGLKLMNLLPYQLIDFINAKLPGKPSFMQQHQQEK